MRRPTSSSNQQQRTTTQKEKKKEKKKKRKKNMDKIWKKQQQPSSSVVSLILLGFHSSAHFNMPRYILLGIRLFQPSHQPYGRRARSTMVVVFGCLIPPLLVQPEHRLNTTPAI
jgi:hypothetical protein